MISEIILFSVFNFILLVCAILVHELGHHHMLKKHYPLAKDPMLYVGKKRLQVLLKVEWDKGSLTETQEWDVYMAGILYGFFPLLIGLSTVTRYPVIWFATIVLYLFGCKHDFKQLWGLRHVKG